jgi:hypothetical protein
MQSFIIPSHEIQIVPPIKSNTWGKGEVCTGFGGEALEKETAGETQAQMGG